MSKGSKTGRPRLASLLCAAAAAVAALLAVSAATASAKVVHQHLFNFEQGAAEGTSFKENGSLAVDNASSGGSRGDIYVALGSGKLVDKYEADGTYVCQITGAGSATTSKQECDETGTATKSGTLGLQSYGVAVDGSGNVFVTGGASGVINEFNEEGSWLSEVSAFYPKFMALDASGDIYTSSLLSSVEENKLESGKYTKVSLGSPGGSVEGIAVDASTGSAAGYLYAGGGQVVHIYDASGKLLSRQVTGAPGEPFEKVSAVAVDPTNGDLYVADLNAGVVDEFGPGGEPFITQIALPAGAKPHALAVSAVSGDLYVWNSPEGSEGQIEVFGPNVVVPNTSVTAPAREDIHDTSVTVHGEVEPSGGEVTSCVFEYGETTSYGHEVSCVPHTPYTSNQEVSATISGLSPSTRYHFRLSAEDESSGLPSHTEDASFATSGPPKVEREWAIAAPHVATLNMEATPFGYDTTCAVQYVSEAQYEASGYEGVAVVPCAPADLGEGFSPTKAIMRVGGLQVDTTYHYRFVLESGEGTEYGPDKTFATFGIESFGVAFTEDGEGHAYTQAGGHPFGMTTMIAFNRTTFENGVITPSGTVKDVHVQLPVGTAGNPSAAAKCTQYDAETFQCSPDAEIGIMEVEEAETENATKLPHVFVGPLFNLVPPRGVAARFSARFNNKANAYIDATVRTGEGYGIEASSLNITGIKQIGRVTVKVWGVPGSPAHNGERYCRIAGASNYAEPPCISKATETAEVGENAFLTTPTSCAPLSASATADAYQAPGEYVAASGSVAAMEGCSRLHFTPSIAVTPHVSSADSPTGLTVDLKIPQNEDPNGLAEANLKDATVSLPAGMTVNPAEAQGLVGCPLLTGKGAHPGVAGIDLEDAEAGKCPEASKIGNVVLKTPLFPEKHFNGGIYLARQNANPFGSLLALYIAIDEPETGVVIKLAGHVEANGANGQLTTTFDENPQLPFEDLKLEFFGGQRAPLATPESCGTYGTGASFTSWAEPGEAVKPLVEAMRFTSAPGGGACAAPGFAPGFTAGTSNNVGGAFSPFTMTLTRRDGEQRLGTVDMTMPPGMEGMISKVAQCPIAAAVTGACPAASQIGHVVTEVGVGGQPDTLPEAGKAEDPVYLTQGYGGAPFGLVFVVHAEAGPFNLGTVIVQAKILVNPHTAQVTVVSNPMPQILKGVPVDVKALHVVIDRAGFMLNPTSCAPMSVAGTIGSQEGATAAVTSRFQAAGCRGLAFKPKFSALIHAHHTRKNGEYMHVVVKSGAGQANIGKVHVTLPSKLPARLGAALKNACTVQQFDANPAACPAQAIVGHATAHTPILPVPLEGPAVFVSHGGSGFPDLALLLQGDGVHITLIGKTFIHERKKQRSITTTTFSGVPDVPVSRFDLVLPAAPNSALGGNGNMCNKPLYMPTVITGQNGAVHRQNTRLMVRGCKPEIGVMGHKVKGARARIRIRVPSAGKLVVNGHGIDRVAKRVRKAKLLTVTVHLNRHDRRAAAKRHLKIRVKVKLRFKPKHGKTLHAQTRVLLR